MSPFKVIIIGGGLSGTLLANGLLREDIDVVVYERLSKDKKREGYQIRLGADALKGFRACLDPTHISAIVEKFGRANGSRSAAPICYDKNLRVLLDATKFPTYNKSAPINRILLRDALAEPIDKVGRLMSGKQFVKYAILKPGTREERVRVTFADGDWEDCDLLIGADGSHSKINQQVGLSNIRQIDSHVSLIAKCELPTGRYQQLSPQLRNFPLLTYADNMCMYYCAYLPDAADGKGGNFDEDLSSCMFGIHVPTEVCPPQLAELSNIKQWEFLRTALRGWAAEYHEILDLLTGAPLYVYHGRASTRPAKNWRLKAQLKGGPEQGHPRVWLLGDAMHAMLPARGMGGNTAMCDTATVLPLLKSLHDSNKKSRPVSTAEIADKLKHYEDQMIPRAFGWVEKSGGINIMPIDSNKWTGRLFFFLAAQAMNVAYVWYWIVGLLTKAEYVDEAPELKT